MSKLERVDWNVEAGTETFSGTVQVGTSGGLRFGFPTDAPLTSLTLRGYDSFGLLRAGADLNTAELSGTTPHPVLFHLYDEFQAVVETTGPPLLWHRVYLDAGGGVVFLGGTEGATPRKTVERFTLASGAITEIGELLHARSRFGSFLLQDGRIVLAGGAERDTERTVEIWNPSTNDSQPVSGLLRFPRLEPDVFAISNGDVWIADGNGSASVLPADVIIGNAVVGTSLTRFVTDSGRVTFLDETLINEKMVRWGGFQGFVRTYDAVSPNELSAEGLSEDFYFPARLRGSSDVVLWTGRHAYCNDVAVVPPNGLLSGARFLSLTENLCASAVLRESSDRVLVMGGANDTDPAQNKVRSFDLNSGLFADELAPDGQLQKLVYPRIGAEAVRLPDGSVIVIGGTSRFIDPDLNPDLSPMPRVEFRVPAPAAVTDAR